METYSVKEASEILGISTRAVQKRCKSSKVRKKNNKYLITNELISLWRTLNELNEPRTNEPHEPNELSSQKGTQLDLEVEALRIELQELKAKKEEEADTHQERLKRAIELVTIEASRQGVTHKIFTEEEYQDVIGTLETVNYQEEQINYLRNRIEKQDQYLQKLFQTLEQRNYIEAKDKGHS